MDQKGMCRIPSHGDADACCPLRGPEPRLLTRLRKVSQLKGKSFLVEKADTVYTVLVEGKQLHILV